ncbi:unnamed protein product, partial [Ilex paraguariensis]
GTIMRIKENSQDKLRRYIRAPKRFLRKARDFYVESLVNFDGRVAGVGKVMGGPHPPLAKHFGSRPRKSKDKDELMELFGSISRWNIGSKEETDVQGVNERRGAVTGYNGMGRSFSVGLGRIGTIDEEKPYDYEEEEINVIDILFSRSRSYAVSNRRVEFY